MLSRRHSSWYQVPVLYGWWDLTAGGEIRTASAADRAAGNGHAGQRSAQRRTRIVEGESA